jgi:hypothetical protein
VIVKVHICFRAYPKTNFIVKSVKFRNYFQDQKLYFIQILKLGKAILSFGGSSLKKLINPFWGCSILNYQPEIFDFIVDFSLVQEAIYLFSSLSTYTFYHIYIVDP